MTFFFLKYFNKIEIKQKKKIKKLEKFALLLLRIYSYKWIKITL